MSLPAGPSLAPPLALGVRLNLSIMMLLQFAIWGSWFVAFTPYVKSLGYTSTQAGDLMGNMALGAIISTLFAGFIADRYFASEKMMAVLHLVGAALLYQMAQIGPNDFSTLYWVSLAYAVLYNPTLALSNSIAFAHVPDATRDFPGLRVLGTIGWVVVGYTVDIIFKQVDASTGTVIKSASETNGPLLLAAGLSAVLGVYSFFLPHTPPKGQAGDAIPFVRALGLFKDYSFAVFFFVSLGITIVLSFYYSFTGDYLGKKVGIVNVPSTMAIGQLAEMVLLPLLPLFLYRFGMKWVLAFGMLCWGIRYLCFSQGGPQGVGFALAIIGVALHGICFDFFFAAGFIHVDNQAPRDIRASGQALFSFLTYGVGMWLGSLVAGRLLDAYTREIDGVKVTDWAGFWQVPAYGVLIAFTVFVLFFRMTPTRNSDAV